MAGIDELLTPTLSDRRPATARPFRVGSQGYVAFFGGVLAVTIVAAVNAVRLGLPRRTQALMGAIAAAALAGEIVVALSADDGTPRLARTAFAMAAFAGFWWLQRSAERVHQYYARGEEPFARLLPLGLALCVVPGIPELMVLAAL